MNGASRLRHRSSARHKASNRTKSAPSANRLFVFTIDADTARIIKFETVDGSGERRELSQDEKTALVAKGNGERLEEVVEQAFEAGIACALSEDLGDPQTEETEETGEDAELRHLLLAKLIEQSGIKHLMTSEVLDRAIFGTLIQHAIDPARAAAGSGTAPAPQERAHTN
jgi:hypothetical protein